MDKLEKLVESAIGDTYQITDGEGRVLTGRIIKVQENGVYVQWDRKQFIESEYVGIIVTFEPYPQLEAERTENGRGIS